MIKVVFHEKTIWGGEDENIMWELCQSRVIISTLRISSCLHPQVILMWYHLQSLLVFILFVSTTQNTFNKTTQNLFSETKAELRENFTWLQIRIFTKALNSKSDMCHGGLEASVWRIGTVEYDGKVRPVPPAINHAISLKSLNFLFNVHVLWRKIKMSFQCRKSWMYIKPKWNVLKTFAKENSI